MKITYIFHSCFIIETEQCMLMFDYWTDPAGAAERLSATDKPTYILASHFHEDHFNREIFKWKKLRNNIRYILSKDILRHRRARREEADAWLAKGGTWSDGLVDIKATGSTDSGVSWIVETGGMRIFHAGDLNNWYARFLTDDYKGGKVYSPEFGSEVDPEREEKLYLGELKDIRKTADSFDVVMFPVDSRIGNGYTRGARQFIERFNVKTFIPMHFVAGGFESAWRMKEFTDEKGISFWCITKEGETLYVSSNNNL